MTSLRFKARQIEKAMQPCLTGATADEVAPLVLKHHYSKRMPSNIQHCYVVRSRGGLFGDFGDIQAAVVFTIPPTRWGEEVLELARLVRLPDCSFPLSRLVAFACGFLKKAKWNLLVSFADRTQGHHGGVYQACGWFYDGCRDRRIDGVFLNGKFICGRAANHKWGTRSPSKLAERGIIVEPHYDEGKHLYWKALHNSDHRKARALGLASVPYPKPAACRMDELDPTSASQAQPLEAAPFREPKQEALI